MQESATNNTCCQTAQKSPCLLPKSLWLQYTSGSVSYISNIHTFSTRLHGNIHILNLRGDGNIRFNRRCLRDRIRFRLSLLNTCRKIDRRQNVLNRFRKIDRRSSLIWLPLGPGGFARLMIEYAFDLTHSFPLFLGASCAQTREWFNIGSRLNMLMKLEAGNPGKQTLADNITGEVKDNWIVCASRDVLARGVEAKFSDVNSAQQGAAELSLIDELLAAE